jgi:hypothetical protein
VGSGEARHKSLENWLSLRIHRVSPPPPERPRPKEGSSIPGGERRSKVQAFARLEWQKLRERNEALDIRVYARAAAWIVGLDRWSEERPKAGAIGSACRHGHWSARDRARHQGEDEKEDDEPRGRTAPRPPRPTAGNLRHGRCPSRQYRQRASPIAIAIAIAPTPNLAAEVIFCPPRQAGCSVPSSHRVRRSHSVARACHTTPPLGRMATDRRELL